MYALVAPVYENVVTAPSTGGQAPAAGVIVPTDAQHEPPGHVRHVAALVAPTVALYVPDAHGAGAAPAAHHAPAAHGTHDEKFAWKPAAHAKFTRLIKLFPLSAT